MIHTKAAAEVWDWTELLQSPYQAPSWIVQEILPERGSVLIAAKEGTGKSILGMQLALCISTGTPFVGLDVPQPRPVLYLQCEGDLGDTAQRGIDMQRMFPMPKKGMFTQAYLLNRKLNTRPGLENLRQLAEIAEMKGGVIFIDPAYPTIRGSMKDDEPVAEWTDNVNHVSHEFESAVVVFQHEHREIRDSLGQRVKESIGEKTFGSFGWKAWASYGFSLFNSSGKGGPLLLQAWKQRRPTALFDEPLKLTLVEPTPLGFVRCEEGVTGTMATISALLRYGGYESLSKDELVAILSRDQKHGFRRTAIQNAIDALEATDAIDVVADTWPRRYISKGGIVG